MSHANVQQGFPRSRPHGEKRHAGITDVRATPLVIRTHGMRISDGLEALIRRSLASKLERFADRIQRLTIRFEDINGPKGGIGVLCRAKTVLHGLPTIVTEERAQTDVLAFNPVADAMVRAIRKNLERTKRTRHKLSHAQRSRRATPQGPETLQGEMEIVDEGSLIGRRVGRGPVNLAAALERPEKARRDLPVDTSLPGISATQRKAGGRNTARRNTMAKTTRATATLEDSEQPQPSRKSTRRSANRAKAATNLQKRVIAQTTSASARARRSRATRQGF